MPTDKCTRLSPFRAFLALPTAFLTNDCFGKQTLTAALFYIIVAYLNSNAIFSEKCCLLAFLTKAWCALPFS